MDLVELKNDYDWRQYAEINFSAACFSSYQDRMLDSAT